MLLHLYSTIVVTTGLLSTIVSAQNNCYYGPGAGFRGPSNLVACNSSAEFSPCCLSGDTCLTGNACYNYASGNVYQYGCTDLNYEDESCPRKCNFDPSNSPWAGLEYCNDIQDLTNTWTCLSPESCGCEWNSSIGYSLALLPSRGCAAMGSDARVALFAPSTLLAYVSLPPTPGGSTGYYSATTDSAGSYSIISTAIRGYTPASSDFTLPTTYRAAPTTASYINAAATASPSTLSPAEIWTATTPYTPPADATSTGTATSSGSSTGTSSATSTSTSSSSGLSEGAQIGIGVGVGVGGAILLALGAFFFLRHRKSKKTAAAAASAPSAPDDHKHQSPPQPGYPSPQQQPTYGPNGEFMSPYMSPQKQMQMNNGNT